MVKLTTTCRIYMAEFHFDEIIKVIGIDDKRYEKVSRIEAQSEDEDVYLELDVHSQLYRMLQGEKFRMVVSHTLNADGSAVTGHISEGKQKSLADKFEYVMHGLLYKMSEDKEKQNDGSNTVKVVVYISFGGLQLMLKGDPLKMHKFRLDQRLFLLLRKI
ncbi:DNA-directed RNA polymerases II, IV and V subunit 8B-like isoform X1 [Olea europaea var. sylvestris]|uniref:DNA-directed RNA polymerases II, IV and V subunit 8B-like isoform X1 n=2 Tax=Olea europaea var. sylvestris TaxID=158386 RepID=UPI000C1D1925|nr:DNA-directed RNA polymerases II, IV and V subunit 8B-like isoform X1 [Olea europaea var. sylvestris]